PRTHTHTHTHTHKVNAKLHGNNSADWLIFGKYITVTIRALYKYELCKLTIDLKDHTTHFVCWSLIHSIFIHATVTDNHFAKHTTRTVN
ncbi:hypothetical protein LDENG_00171810, partial [Lucifuga dentata]